MAASHYRGASLPETELSSWAASFAVALRFADGEYGPRGRHPHLAVFDTQALGNGVEVWHAPQLIGRGDHEYLAHGLISGEGYKAVAVADLEKAALRELRDGELAQEEVFAGSKSVARLFGEAFAMPVALALVTWVPRESWTGVVAILVEGAVAAGRWEEVERQGTLMRELTDYGHGRSVRQREFGERAEERERARVEEARVRESGDGDCEGIVEMEVKKKKSGKKGDDKGSGYDDAAKEYREP
ncbi:hypothetical protein BU16DRAFT_562465 [Lophium mytilinum]|uniref:Uncharacterized protein n=1 Tax=Lophium mytilinum TaxID=390894 RepID=A0A6A6QR18_9PEZI|nr:hypothetical protein BU16DRAFT_562465 [Lophium mytilinum]